jgi:hypothetical protein
MAKGTSEQDRGVGRIGHRTSTWLASSLWSLCVALATFSVFLDLYTPPTENDPNFRALAGAPLLVYPTVGALVASRRPKNAVGYVLLGLGIVLEVQAFAAAYPDYVRPVYAIQHGARPNDRLLGDCIHRRP